MSRPFSRSRILVSVLALAGLLRAAPTLAQDSSGATTRLTDAEIAAVVVVANTADIEAGKVALSRTSNPDVEASRRRWSPITAP